MRKIIKKNIYTPVIQKPFCCIPSSLFMILERRKIPHGDQEDIGSQLGLAVPKKVSRHFRNVKITTTTPIKDCGTRVIFTKGSLINNFFKKNKIPLQEKYFPLRKISDIGKFIKSNIEKDNDIIAFYHQKKLYPEGIDWGHASLIQEIDKKITLIDPARKSTKIKEVSLKNLVKAIEYYGEKNRAGFWIISKNNKN